MMQQRAPEREPILIVEDDPVSRAILERVAADQGLEPLVCGDAESAWELFQDRQPGLVVLDWLLPGMNGLELCRRIRHSPGGRRPVILMITGQDRPEDLEQALLAGVSFYMIKPVRTGFFQAWLGAALAKLAEHRLFEQREAEVHQYQQELEEANRQLEEALSRAHQLAMDTEQAYIELNQIFRTVAGGIVLVGEDCRILRCNDAFLEMTGCTQEEVKNQNCYEVFHSILCASPACPLQRIKNGEARVDAEIAHQPPDGEVVHYQISATPFRGPGGDLIGIVEHIMDISSRVRAEQALKESEQRYRELSIVDELTGLYNKRHFNRHLAMEAERASRYGHPFSLLMMDIDNFKHHNDTYGHADGDRVLARLGRIIADSIRTNDLGCRYGGEEFVVILPETTGQDACVVAERVRARFEAERFEPRPGEFVHKTLSIGVAEFTGTEEPGELLERADRNLYTAKKTGKNRWVFA